MSTVVCQFTRASASLCLFTSGLPPRGLLSTSDKLGLDYHIDAVHVALRNLPAYIGAHNQLVGVQHL